MLFVSILVFAVINIGLLELTIRSLNDDEGDERSRENQINENKSIRELQERALNTTEWSFDGRQDGQEWK